MLVVITSFFILLRPPLATLWAPAVLQSVTPTAIKGVAMFQDYVPLSDSKNTHDHTHASSVLTSVLPSSHKGIVKITGQTHTQTHTHNVLDLHSDIITDTHSKGLCVFAPLLFVLAVVHWIYLLALRRQCTWEPNTLELWEMKSKVKARNTLQCVLCMGIFVGGLNGLV